MVLRLRRVSERDEALLLHWANETMVRSAARIVSPISSAEHHTWFRRKLLDPMCRMWIAEDGDASKGQIRLDRMDDTADVDISVAHNARNCGVGFFMLNARDLLEWIGLRRLRASVRDENVASLALFRRAGFIAVSNDQGFVEFLKDIDATAR